MFVQGPPERITEGNPKDAQNVFEVPDRQKFTFERAR